MNGAGFLRGVVSAFAYAIHTVLTDGMASADLPKNRGRHPAVEAMFGGPVFDRVCTGHGIQHRLTRPCHPWTNGQAERMNRTVKDAAIKAFHDPDLESLRLTSWLWCQPASSPSPSKPSGGEHRSKPSARPGRQHRRSSN